DVQSTSTRVQQSAVENFTRELANLLAAGLPLSRALQLLRREASNPGAKNVWGKIHDDVVGGTSLADALAKWPKVFSTVYIAMIRAGEAGGFLPIVLGQISDFRVREQDLKGKVKAAMVYPSVLALLAVGVVVFLLTFFIPRFKGIFEEFHGSLPLLTQGIVAISGWLQNYGLFIGAGVFVAIVALRRAATSEAGRRAIERAILKTPLLGTVVARFALVRFCRMLGTLAGAGVPLVNSLKVAKEAIGNQTLADTVATAIDEVRRGVPLSRSLSGSPLLFPASVIEMIAIAEETGRLDKELVRLSITYEADLDRNLRMLVSLAEPAMLFIMAGLIGTIVIGMLLPVFTLQDLIH
ncbi:MAG TPA: type II secretion system F family protein, partial [Tepidisphaeraceae bacterium]|nr:type II secretion system F family protein [Tepidisphaeraceae bacterium]